MSNTNQIYNVLFFLGLFLPYSFALNFMSFCHCSDFLLSLKQYFEQGEVTVTHESLDAEILHPKRGRINNTPMLHHQLKRPVLGQYQSFSLKLASLKIQHLALDQLSFAFAACYFSLKICHK